ncbi:MAG: TRAP transporter small permease subunit [Burkholderiaceae bacterium]
MVENDNRAGAPAALSGLLGAVDRGLSAIERTMIGLVVAVVVASMFLVAADALGRYLFNRPVIFTVELVSHYLLPIVMLLPASYVLRRGGHISVDMFALAMPVRLFQALYGMSLLAVAPVVWIMATHVTSASIESFQQGKVSFGLIPWPLWAEQGIYVAILWLVFARLLHVAITNILAAVTGHAELGISALNSHDSPLEQAG